MKRAIIGNRPGNRPKMLLALLLAAALAAGLLALVGPKPAEAAFPGANGKIAFASNRRNLGKSKYAIYTANSSDGSEVTRITRRPKRANDLYPVFSPDGNKLAFAKRGGTFVGGGNDYNIFTMNADGTARTKLTGAAGIDFDPNWGSAP